MKYIFRFIAFLFLIFLKYLIFPIIIIIMLILYTIWTLELYDFKKDPMFFNLSEYHQVVLKNDIYYSKLYYKNVWDFLTKQNLIKKEIWKN